jgi:hypothetical protein
MLELVLVGCAAFVVAARLALAVVPPLPDSSRAATAGVSTLAALGALIFALNVAFGYAAGAAANDGAFAAGAMIGSTLAGALAGGLLVGGAVVIALYARSARR